MGRYIGGNFSDPIIEEDETIFEETTSEELLEMKIQEHLEEEEMMIENIKLADPNKEEV